MWRLVRSWGSDASFLTGRRETTSRLLSKKAEWLDLRFIFRAWLVVSRISFGGIVA
jgi:hypothetical protein